MGKSPVLKGRTVKDSEIEEFAGEVYKTLDAMSPQDVAAQWAFQACWTDGSGEGAFIYQMYANKQAQDRKTAIRNRFAYLNSPEGSLELEEEMRRIGRAS